MNEPDDYGPDEDFLSHGFTQQEIEEAEAKGFSPDDDQWIHRDCPESCPDCIFNGTCVAISRGSNGTSMQNMQSKDT